MSFTAGRQAAQLPRLNLVQVVHHPTIMAAYCEGRKWRVTGDGELRSKFLGPSIQLRPVGIMHLTFHDGDEFTWHKVIDNCSQLQHCPSATQGPF